MKVRTYIIEIKNEEGELVTFVADTATVEFYRKETGHKRVTKCGLSKFINHLIDIYIHR